MSANNRALAKSSLSFETLAGLSDTDVSLLQAGDISFVQNEFENTGFGHYAFLPTSAAALSGVLIVAAAGGAGRWVRLSIANG